MAKERRRSVHDIFPVTEKAATDAAHVIIGLGRNPSTFPVRLLDMAVRIRRENPEVVKLLFDQLASLDRMVRQIDPGFEADVWLGAVYGYEALKREAQLRDGRLPIVNSAQIQTYIRDHIGEDRPTPQPDLKLKMAELGFAEQHFVEGYRILIRGLQVDKSKGRIVFGSTYQMYAIFKTHSEIQKVRQLVR